MNVDDEQQADDNMQRNIKAMKMPELKEALTARNLPTKGKWNDHTVTIHQRYENRYETH